MLTIVTKERLNFLVFLFSVLVRNHLVSENSKY